MRLMNDRQQTGGGGVRIYSGEYAAHAHDYSQVLFGLEGCLELDLAGRAARVDGTSGLVVPAGVMHSYCSQSDTQVWVVDAAVDRGLDRLRAFQLPARWKPSMDARSLLAGIVDAPRVLQRRALDPLSLQEQVLASLHEDWSTARMASLNALSVAQFHRRWLALTGQTPQRWLRLLRLEVAAGKLRAGLSLDVVAPSVGYRSASALCQALQREQGVGARQLRHAPR